MLECVALDWYWSVKVKHQVSAVDHQCKPMTKGYDVQNFKFSPTHLLSGRFDGLKLLVQGLCLLF